MRHTAEDKAANHGERVGASGSSSARAHREACTVTGAHFCAHATYITRRVLRQECAAAHVVFGATWDTEKMPTGPRCCISSSS